MRHTFLVEIDTDALGPDDTLALQTALAEAVESLRPMDGVRRINATWFQSHRGYIIGSGESTSDVCAPNSPDMRYAS
jgi:hypothetical protein